MVDYREVAHLQNPPPDAAPVEANAMLMVPPRFAEMIRELEMRNVTRAFRAICVAWEACDVQILDDERDAWGELLN